MFCVHDLFEILQCLFDDLWYVMLKHFFNWILLWCVAIFLCNLQHNSTLHANVCLNTIHWMHIRSFLIRPNLIILYRYWVLQISLHYNVWAQLVVKINASALPKVASHRLNTCQQAISRRAMTAWQAKPSRNLFSYSSPKQTLKRPRA